MDMDLRLENLVKRFGNKPVVEIPSLTIHHGEFFTFVGPSGCGKSTTLNLIAGLEQPTAGTLRLGDRLLNDLAPHKRDVAFVFQSYALYPHRTVFRNLAFPLELAGTSPETIRGRVEQAAALLGLTSLLAKYPRELSGGERQRVAVGRAIVRQPRLFLLDEPLSNLDAPLRAQTRRELKHLHQQLGTTFIYVTHDQEEALSLSDRVAVMQGGRIEQCGSPREVYDQPANRFVASFFGSPAMNFLEAELDASEGVPRLRLAGHTLSVPGLEAMAGAPASVAVGIRPEDIRVSREPVAEGWPARVSLVELHGGQTHLELDLADLPLTAVDRSEAAYQAGEEVWALVASDRFHLFDPHTGARLPRSS